MLFKSFATQNFILKQRMELNTFGYNKTCSILTINFFVAKIVLKDATIKMFSRILTAQKTALGTR